jgi:hypothetical protein
VQSPARGGGPPGDVWRVINLKRGGREKSVFGLLSARCDMGWYDDYGPGADEAELDYLLEQERQPGGLLSDYDSEDYYDYSEDYDGGGRAWNKKRALDRDAKELRAVGDKPWIGADNSEDELFDDYEQCDLDGSHYFVDEEYKPPACEYEEDEEESKLPIEEVAQRIVDGAEASGIYLTPVEAAEAAKYEDVNAAGSFSIAADGVTREYEDAASALPASYSRTPYESLRAFDTGVRGFGVCCTEQIHQGDVVVECVGRLLGYGAFEKLKDPTYVVSFDDATVEAKRAASQPVAFDAREFGNMMRLINDDTDAPNLRLMYWPEQHQADGIVYLGDHLPRRAYLVANEDIPAYTELTWDYGPHYPRPWLPRSRGLAVITKWEDGKRIGCRMWSSRTASKVAPLDPSDANSREMARALHEADPRNDEALARALAPAEQEDEYDEYDDDEDDDDDDDDEYDDDHFARRRVESVEMVSDDEALREALRDRALQEALRDRALREAHRKADDREADESMTLEELVAEGAAHDGGTRKPKPGVLGPIESWSSDDGYCSANCSDDESHSNEEIDHKRMGLWEAIEKAKAVGPESLSEHGGSRSKFNAQSSALKAAAALKRIRQLSQLKLRCSVKLAVNTRDRFGFWASLPIGGRLKRRQVRDGELWHGPFFHEPPRCDSCQCERWPPPLFSSSSWPRTATVINRDDDSRCIEIECLYSRKHFAHPKFLVCSCTPEERESAQLELEESVTKMNEAAKLAATCGAEPLEAAMADACLSALDTCLAVDDEPRIQHVLDPPHQLVLSESLHTLAHMLHKSTLQPPLAQEERPTRPCWNWNDELDGRKLDGPSPLAAHCLSAKTVTDLTAVWSAKQPGDHVLDDGSMLDMLSTLLKDPIGCALDGLHWVGYACKANTGRQMARELLELVAAHLRAPRAKFIEDGGIDLVIRHMKTLPLRERRGLGELHDSGINAALSLVETLANSEKAATEKLVQTDAPSSLARLMTTRLVDADSDALYEPSSGRAGLCQSTLAAMKRWHGGNSETAEKIDEAVKQAEDVAEQVRRQREELVRQREEAQQQKRKEAEEALRAALDRSVMHKARSDLIATIAQYAVAAEYGGPSEVLQLARAQRDEQAEEARRQQAKRRQEQQQQAAARQAERKRKMEEDKLGDPCCCSVCGKRLKTPDGALTHRKAVHGF